MARLGRTATAARPVWATDAEAPPPKMTGKYRLLSDYLYRRHADTIVLTFAEIEDLLGFRLPEQAWNQPEWWTSRDPSSASHADAWTLARRTAVPNLLARTVVFDRAC